MVTAAFLGYGLAHLWLLGLGVRLLRRDHHWAYLIICLSIATLVYDNVVVGLGGLIGEGALLRSLNYLRFVLHALTTPLLIMAGLALARRAGVRWAGTRAAAAAFAALTAVMLAWAVRDNILNLQLEPARSAGTLRYANGAMSGPPVPELATVVALLVCGGAIYARSRWPWMLAGAATMFVLAAVAASLGVVSNLGEVALMSGLIATAYHVTPRPDPMAAAPVRPSAATRPPQI